ncbi:leucine-rich repeat-containing protein 27-like isoform X1 [Siniperca chuatsi]|uniref:leucine-rich repeat-containing protein 27-like isoform X1 n=1 Tax=Siniperca chuatsi TaxID=119488 RepID=UPI001CE217F4|nr:leucine-rich repeat-containing protein 27-like isoform X1 [Siniperca chuatsi]
MSSPEKEVVPDLQLSFVFGNRHKPQTPHILPEDAEPQELPEYYSTETLCLSRTKLKHVAGSILNNSTLKYLYLEGNQVSSIPDSIFISLPNLLWLDLRNNQIATLPAEIGLHRSLRTLLLEGNPISELPPELGNVITLKGLNLRNCPISFPPQDIVNQGLQSILQYLRSAMAKRPISVRKTPRDRTAGHKNSSLPWYHFTGVTSVALETARATQLTLPPPFQLKLPVVEKLQLSELMGSSMEEQDESLDEDELQRFRELKHKMILLDKAELGSIAQGDRNQKSCLPITQRKKATPKAGIVPKLTLFDTQHWKKPEERRQVAMKELKEKQAILEQRRKSQEALRKWHTQVKITQEKKMPEHKQKKHERQRKQEEAETDSKPGVEDSSDTPQASRMSITECEEARSARELERQIRARVEKMQERRRNPGGTPTEQMAAAEQDVEEMRKLQTRLLERKRNRGRDLENCFTIFTGDTWQSFLDK